VPLPDELMTAMIKREPSFYRTQFPISPDIYRGLSNKVETLGYPNLIIANKDKVSDAQAYGMTKAVAENMEKIAAVEPSLKGFNLKDMAINVGVPIHPGSMKYFKERGWR
jgi:TRAP transporter TAXI family solute receptor